MDNEKVVIINNGSRSCRVGLAGDDEPRVFPSVVGRPRSKSTKVTKIGAGITIAYNKHFQIRK